MARRATKATAQQTPPEADPVAAAVRLAGLVGWHNLSLADVAAECGMSLAQLYPRYHSKGALAAAFMERIDQTMLDRLAAEETEEAMRDRLFAAIMARFDALQPHRDGVCAIARDSARDPILALRLTAGPMRRSLDCLLESVGLSAEGLPGALRRKAVGALYLATFRSWMRDESSDLGATMATLDRLLTRWGPILERIGGRRGGRAG